MKTVDAGALVGGVTATALDTNTTAQRDLVIIIPVVLVGHPLYPDAAAALRSGAGPAGASVVLSYGAAMGVSALVFNNIFGFPGADATVPLFGFVFLVALGVDYNIFLMSRVREESLKHGTRPGILRGLGVTGGVITSAGVVLAATFAALGVIPIMFLVQLAFIVAFGVLLDTVWSARCWCPHWPTTSVRGSGGRASWAGRSGTRPSCGGAGLRWRRETEEAPAAGRRAPSAAAVTVPAPPTRRRWPRLLPEAGWGAGQGPPGWRAESITNGRSNW